MDETTTVTTRKLDKNTVEVTTVKTQTLVSTYPIDDLYDNLKAIEKEKEDLAATKDEEIEQAKKIISDAEALEITPIDETKKPSK